MVASISAVSSASAGAQYYGKDNYYARGKDETEPSSWWGKGAAELGLKGPIDAGEFERVLTSEKTDQTPPPGSDKTHRPGIDLTFSPPKDVSLLLYLGGDKRILSAHRGAVDRTLSWAEKNLAGTRLRKGKGPSEAVKTGTLVVAKFEHDISCDKDPQLHTHCVIANTTKAADGTWRALNNDPFFAHRKTLSIVYDAEMRNELRALGYAVELENGKTGAYTVRGVPDAAREEFSKGLARINAAAAGLSHPTPAAKSVLAVKTRPAKTELSQAARDAQWQARGGAWKDDLQRLVGDAERSVADGQSSYLLDRTEPNRRGFEGLRARLVQTYFRPTKTLPSERDDPYGRAHPGSEAAYAARAAVSFALRHHEERDAAFSLHHVRRTALEHGADGLTLADIDKELRLIRQSKKLLVRTHDPNAEATTRRAIDHETETKDLVAQADKPGPLVYPLLIEKPLKDAGLTRGQRTAIEAILCRQDRLVGVQGYAGTGKTTMMRHTLALIKDVGNATEGQSFDMMGIAPTHAARRTLAEAAGIETHTVPAFLRETQNPKARPDLSYSIVVVDESSFLWTKSMNQLLERLLEMRPARIVLSGDRRQHGAIEAGRPFDLAQKSDMITAVMKDIVRTPGDAAHADLKAAIGDAAVGNIRPALKRLEANITEPGGDLASAAVAAWRGLPMDRREAAMIVAPTHRLREEINHGIRSALIAEGKLGSEETELSILRAKDMTRAEALSPRSYAPGDVLQFHRRVDALNARPGHRREVVSVDEDRGRLTLRNAKGREQNMRLSRLVGRQDTAPFGLYRFEKLSVREGDSLLFTRSDRNEGIAALDPAKVTAIGDNMMTLETAAGPKNFPRSHPVLSSLTHGYAITSHAAQGQTAQDVIAVIDSKEPMLTSQVALYVSVSRTADTLSLIVDDKEKVTSALLRHTGLNASALETEKRLTDITGLDKDPLNSAKEDSSATTDNNASREATTSTPALDREPDIAQEIGMDRDMSM